MAQLRGLHGRHHQFRNFVTSPAFLSHHENAKDPSSDILLALSDCARLSPTGQPQGKVTHPRTSWKGNGTTAKENERKKGMSSRSWVAFLAFPPH
jgi:hypothetical protein